MICGRVPAYSYPRWTALRGGNSLQLPVGRVCVFPNAPRDFAGMQTSAVASAVVWKVRHARVENVSRIPVGGSIMTGCIP